jgi:hypothetical protein
LLKGVRAGTHNGIANRGDAEYMDAASAKEHNGLRTFLNVYHKQRFRQTLENVRKCSLVIAASKESKKTYGPPL